MKPSEFLRQSKITAAEVADMMGVDVSSVYKPASGHAWPSFALMVAFHRLSDGMVGIGDWIRVFEDHEKAGMPLPAKKANPLEFPRKDYANGKAREAERQRA